MKIDFSIKNNLKQVGLNIKHLFIILAVILFVGALIALFGNSK